MGPFTLTQATDLLPLVKAIASELVERWNGRQAAMKQRRNLEDAHSPEGLSSAIGELGDTIRAHDEAIAQAQRELEGLGLTVLRLHPLTVHFPGRANMQDVVFCWMEGDQGIEHGHLVGEEDEPRRPLRVRRLDESA